MMKNMKKLTKRGLSAFTAFTMCASLLPTAAFALDAKTLKCDLKEHTHTKECYEPGETEVVQICGLEETEDTTETVEVETPVYETVTETVVDEETGEEKEVTTQVETGEFEISYEERTIPGHTHGVDCYEVRYAADTLVCELEEHVHSDDCYGETHGNINDDSEFTVKSVTFTDTATYEDENGNVLTKEVTVVVDEDGVATVYVDGEVVDATVEWKVEKSDPVNTTGKGETTLVGTETTYKTTYTHVVTTGYTVTYTVIYTVPYTYEVEYETDGSYVDVDVDENGQLIVNGGKMTVTLTMDDEDYETLDLTVTKRDDGTFFVVINNTESTVQAVKTPVEDGKYTITWEFVDEVEFKVEDEEEELDIEGDPVPLSDIPEEEELIDLDVEVPLAGDPGVVPKTGDKSGVWSLLTAFSAAGMLCLLGIERKKRQEENN